MVVAVCQALGREGSSYTEQRRESAISLLIMLPATIAAGMTLPLITLALLRTRAGERSIGHTYAANTLGSIVGCADRRPPRVSDPRRQRHARHGGGNRHPPRCSVDRIPAAPRTARRWRPALAAAGIACSSPFQRRSTLTRSDWPPACSERVTQRCRWGRYLFHRDGNTATVTVTEAPQGLVVISTNGKPDASVTVSGTSPPASDEYTMTLLASIAFAFKPDIRTVAAIGFGSGMTTNTLLGVRTVERVDTIEIEPAMVEGARQFGQRVERAYMDPRSRIIIDDAKSFLRATEARTTSSSPSRRIHG